MKTTLSTATGRLIVEERTKQALGAEATSHITPHSLRHTYGSMVTRETRSIFVAQKLLGHADPRTTARYYAGFEVGDADDAPAPPRRAT